MDKQTGAILARLHLLSVFTDSIFTPGECKGHKNTPGEYAGHKNMRGGGKGDGV